MYREILAPTRRSSRFDLPPCSNPGLLCRDVAQTHKRTNAHSARSRPTPARFQHLLGGEKGVRGEFTLMTGLAWESAVRARC